MSESLVQRHGQKTENDQALADALAAGDDETPSPPPPMPPMVAAVLITKTDDLEPLPPPPPLVRQYAWTADDIARSTALAAADDELGPPPPLVRCDGMTAYDIDRSAELTAADDELGPPPPPPLLVRCDAMTVDYSGSPPSPLVRQYAKTAAEIALGVKAEPYDDGEPPQPLLERQDAMVGCYALGQQQDIVRSLSPFSPRVHTQRPPSKYEQALAAAQRDCKIFIIIAGDDDPGPPPPMVRSVQTDYYSYKHWEPDYDPFYDPFCIQGCTKKMLEQKIKCDQALVDAMFNCMRFTGTCNTGYTIEKLEKNIEREKKLASSMVEWKTSLRSNATVFAAPNAGTAMWRPICVTKTVVCDAAAETVVGDAVTPQPPQQLLPIPMVRHIAVSAFGAEADDDLGRPTYATKYY